MENPSIFVDETAVREFITEVLPDLQNDEILLLILIPRKKYEKSIKIKKWTRREIITTNNLDIIVKKIKRLCYISDFYTDRNGKIIPPHAFVLYAHLLPKSMLKAYRKFKEEMDKFLYEVALGHEPVDKFRFLKNKLLSIIQSKESTAPKRKIYITIDIDLNIKEGEDRYNKDRTLLYKTLDGIKHTYTWINETRGGFHILVNPKELGPVLGEVLFNKLLHSKIVAVSEQAMTPIPGTLQGGFLVKQIRM
jgi:hypothetical protein